jgi:hypothetical protein
MTAWIASSGDLPRARGLVWRECHGIPHAVSCQALGVSQVRAPEASGAVPVTDRGANGHGRDWWGAVMLTVRPRSRGQADSPLNANQR